MSKQVIVITGASSGFGALTARALARAGHTVVCPARAPPKAATRRRSPMLPLSPGSTASDLRSVELDVASGASVEAGVAGIIAEAGRLDAVVHNAGHMSFGPAEAFTRRASSSPSSSTSTCSRRSA